jgi:hypothetical protein
MREFICLAQSPYETAQQLPDEVLQENLQICAGLFMYGAKAILTRDGHTIVFYNEGKETPEIELPSKWLTWAGQDLANLMWVREALNTHISSAVYRKGNFDACETGEWANQDFEGALQLIQEKLPTAHPVPPVELVMKENDLFQILEKENPSPVWTSQREPTWAERFREYLCTKIQGNKQNKSELEPSK